MTKSAVPKIDAAFQTRVASFIARDPVFARRADGLVKPEMFERQGEAQIVAIAQGYYDRYSVTPSTSVMIRLIKEKIDKGQIRKDLAPEIQAAMRDILADKLTDRDYVIDEVAKFARHQAVEAAIIRAVDLKEKGDWETISRDMEKALQVGAAEADNGIDYWANIEERTQLRKDAAAGIRPPTGITTGNADMDKLLYHNGWGIGELTAFMGAPKAGKSTALGEFCKSASFAGKNALYVSLEVSAAIISERLDANIASVMPQEIRDKILEVEDKIKRRAATCGRIRIHQYPAGQFTPRMLQALIDRHRANGEVFDLVAVDYADIMAPNMVTQDPIANSKSVWVDLRSIAMREQVAMLTATQVNRTGSTNKVIRMTDVAEDFNKIRIADLVLSINVSEEERAKNEMRLFFAASRNQKGEFTVRVKRDADRMQFLNSVMGVE